MTLQLVNGIFYKQHPLASNFSSCFSPTPSHLSKAPFTSSLPKCHEREFPACPAHTKCYHHLSAQLQDEACSVLKHPRWSTFGYCVALTTCKAGRKAELLPRSKSSVNFTTHHTFFFFKRQNLYMKKAAGILLDSDLHIRLQGSVLSHRTAGFSRKNNYF